MTSIFATELPVGDGVEIGPRTMYVQGEAQ